MVIKANIQKNPALGVNLKQGGRQSVTNENIIKALGYTPANEADIPTKVSQLENDEKYVKSWEDLPDKPFYIEETISSVTETLFEHEILDSASVPLSGVFYRYNFAENLNLNIEENVKYTLIVNGVEHEASEIDTHNKTLSFANVQIGSLSTPLSIIQTAGKTQIAYRVGSYGTYTLDVSLYSNKKTQIVHPLPEMFLPVHSHEWYDLPLTDDDKIPAIYLPETMGTEGVGIESIEQTTTSTEDDGKNVITVTLTNGKQYNFTVQNGSKGSPGEKGDPGDPGADGEDGADGFSPTVSVTPITGGHRIFITDKKGIKNFDVMDGTGGLNSVVAWENIVNKPFGESEVNTIKSDGTVHGKFVKVSDRIPTANDFDLGYEFKWSTVTNGKVNETVYTTTTGYYSNDECDVLTADGTPLIVFAKVSTPKWGALTFDDIESPGVYFRQDNYWCVHSLTIIGYEFEDAYFTPIPYEYLPEHLRFGKKTTYGDTLTWDGVLAGHELVSIPNEEGITAYYVHVSDLVPTMEDLQNGASVIGEQQGTEISATLPADQLTETDTYIADNGRTVFVAKEDNVDLNGIVFPKKGIYWLYGEYSGAVYMAFYSLTIPGYGMFKHTEIETIPVEYLPESNIIYFWSNGTSLNTNDGTEGFWTPATYRDIEQAYKKGQIIVMESGEDYIPVSVRLVAPYMATITIIQVEGTDGSIVKGKTFQVGTMD